MPTAATDCSGCGANIDCGQRYIVLQLDNMDGTLRATDRAFAYFCAEHCVALLIRHGRMAR